MYIMAVEFSATLKTTSRYYRQESLNIGNGIALKKQDGLVWNDALQKITLGDAPQRFPPFATGVRFGRIDVKSQTLFLFTYVSRFKQDS